MIKLLILDIDGVMTDGTKTYGLDGHTLSKAYCDKDFTAIKRFRATGISVCFLSGDDKVNEAMAKNRNIDFYLTRNKNGSVDKTKFIPMLEKKYNVDKVEIAYVGDDIFDSSIMKEVGYAWCLKDSPLSMRKEFEVIDKKGGENVVAELFDIMYSRGMVEEPSFEKINELDKNENF